MRIDITTTYTIWLSVEEFNLLNTIASQVLNDYQLVDGEYMISLTEDVLDEIEELLEHESYVQEYEECNSFRYREIRDLQDSIYYELNY